MDLSALLSYPPTLSLGLTYSCQTVVEITEELKCADHFTPTKHDLLDRFHTSGGYLKFGPSITLSIQTNPSICGSAFAETLLMGNVSLEMFDQMGYIHHDCIRHPKPADLTAHLRLLLKTFPQPSLP